jgi:hypothetical protein
MTLPQNFTFVPHSNGATVGAQNLDSIFTAIQNSIQTIIESVTYTNNNSIAAVGSSAPASTRVSIDSNFKFCLVTTASQQYAGITLVGSSPALRVMVVNASGKQIAIYPDAGGTIDNNAFVILDIGESALFALEDSSNNWSSTVNPFKNIRYAPNGNVLINTATDDGVNKLQVNGSSLFLGNINLNPDGTAVKVGNTTSYSVASNGDVTFSTNVSFTNSPLVPSLSTLDDSNKAAPTSFVKQLLAGALTPSSLSTSGNVSCTNLAVGISANIAALGGNTITYDTATFTTSVLSSSGSFYTLGVTLGANILNLTSANGIFSSSLTVPTKAINDNSTNAASTAYVDRLAPVSGDFTPTVIGDVSAGSTATNTYIGKYTFTPKLVTINMRSTWTGHSGSGILTIPLPQGPCAMTTYLPAFVTGRTRAADERYVFFIPGGGTSGQLFVENSSGTLSQVNIFSAGTVHVVGSYPKS